MLDIWVVGSVTAPALTVTARLADRVAPLLPDSYHCAGCTDAWHGTLSLEGLPRDTYLLKIEAVDSLGRIAETEQPYFYDQLPRLTIHSPKQYDTANPMIHLHNFPDASPVVSVFVAP
ncbi:MAG: hypothetical protein H0T73_04275 [Ardenticatenales bacterium]|nr:hypothetical protein [Ardenticatenales bacterium]